MKREASILNTFAVSMQITRGAVGQFCFVPAAFFKAPGRFPNRLIPADADRVRHCACSFAPFRDGANTVNRASALFDGVVQGILCTGMSVYLNAVVSHCGGGGRSSGK